MKNIFYVILLLMTSSIAKGQTYYWDWGVCSSGGSEGYAVCTDTKGNVFGSGFSEASTLNFGSFILNGNTGYDAFVVKFDEYGNFIWGNIIKSLATIPIGIVTDTSGNLYLLGTFYDSVISIDTFTLFNTGYGNEQIALFLVKYSPDGNVIWAKNIAQTNTIWTAFPNGGICSDGSNIYITAPFQNNNMSVGSFALSNINPTDSTNDIFIAKVNTYGAIIWAKSIGGFGDEISNSITVTKSNNIYLSGTYTSLSLTIDSITFNNLDSSNIFLAKLDSMGNSIWAKSINCKRGSVCGITSDLSENLFLTGFFDSLFIINYISLYDSLNYPFLYVMKLNPDGSFIWSKVINTQNINYTYMNTSRIVSDRCGNVWISSSMGYAVNIDGHLLIEHAAADPMFIAGWNKSGGYLNSALLVSGGDDYNGIAVDNQGNVYVAGDYYGGPLIFGEHILPYNNDENIFIAKYIMGKIYDTIIGTKSICKFDTITLNAPTGFEKYIWNNGSNETFNLIYDTGNYWIICIPECDNNILIDTYKVIKNPFIYSEIQNIDSTICLPGVLKIKQNNTNFLWQDGSTSDSISIDNPGTYFVILSSQECSITDSFKITVVRENC